MKSNQTYCLNTLFHEINDYECVITRTMGLIIIFASIFSIVFSIRFIYWSSYHRHVRFRYYSLVLSMILSSFSVIIVIMPSVFKQFLSCHRMCSSFYCQLEGFISYLNGCVHMFMLMMISIIRYATVFEAHIKSRFIDLNRRWTIIICWLFGLFFALPPLFNWNKYTPEGIGFHCGLNWFDRSLSSLIYFALALSFIYFIPLLVLLIINLYVYCKIRSLIHSARKITKSDLFLNVSYEKNQSTSFSSSSTASIGMKCENIAFNVSPKSINRDSRLNVRRTIYNLQTDYLMRLNRLKVDQRFALATIFLVSEYLLSWTPYAIVVLFYLFNVKFISQQSILMTMFAFIAKVSMILNPFIYLATIKTNQFKSMLYCSKCSCSYCRMKNILVS